MIGIRKNILISLIILPFLSFAQIDISNADSINIAEKAKQNFHLTVGTSFSSFSGYGNGFSTFAMPTMDYNFNNNFSINAGFMMINNQMHNTPYYSFAERDINSFSGNINQSIFFASGTYQINKKLTILGSAYKQISNKAPSQQVNPQAFNFDNKGMSVGFQYKLSENASFGAEIRTSNGLNPYYNPYQTRFPF
ncbi:MAG: hypothetical protein U9R32_04955 [Bacteroidota bacterium]|nr:hypothetical protein [Bacteroidota bacterium]